MPAYQILRGPEDAAAALKARRKQQRVGQAQLAATQALSRFTITDAESGTGDPKLSTLIKMFRGLGLSLVVVPAMVSDRISFPDIPVDEEEDDSGVPWGDV